MVRDGRGGNFVSAPHDSRQELVRGRKRHTASGHVPEELLCHAGEVDNHGPVRGHDRRYRRHAVGEQVEFLHMLRPDVVGDLFNGSFHAVARCLARDHDHVRFLQHSKEACVHLGRRVVRDRYFGQESAIVLGEHVGSLGDEVDVAHAFLAPAIEGRSQVALHVVTPTANEAVWRPHHEGVLACRFECFGVADSVGAEFRQPRRPGAVLDGRSRNHGKRAGRRAATVAPEGGMRDVNQVVTVERHVNLLELVADAVDKRGQADHVRVGAGHR